MNLTALWAGLPRPAKIYLTVVGGVAVAGVGLAATVAATGTPFLAASPSPLPSPSPSSKSSAAQNYCNDFMSHLAANLGKKQDQVQKAISDSASQTLNDAVKKGDLTQKQADAIKARLNNGSLCARGFGPGIAGIGKEHEARAGASLAEYAKALGISDQELRQDLMNGQTVKDIASSKGLTEADFRSKLADAAKTDLDKQVSAGKLTQAQEDAVLQRIKNDPLPLWDKVMKRPNLPGRFMPKPTPSASSSST